MTYLCCNYHIRYIQPTKLLNMFLCIYVTYLLIHIADLFNSTIVRSTKFIACRHLTICQHDIVPLTPWWNFIIHHTQ